MVVLVAYTDEHGHSPTLREFADLLGFSSLRTLVDHLVVLERHDCIRRTAPRRRRNLYVVEPELWRVEPTWTAADTVSVT